MLLDTLRNAVILAQGSQLTTPTACRILAFGIRLDGHLEPFPLILIGTLALTCMLQ